MKNSSRCHFRTDMRNLSQKRAMVYSLTPDAAREYCGPAAHFFKQLGGFVSKHFALFIASLLLLCSARFAASQEMFKLPFPYGPLGLNSIPWVVAKERRFFEKNGLDVDMVYVGASAVIVQSMLSGSANVAGFGGPAVITNVLRGGDIIQVAAMAPYFTQSLIARADLRDIRALQGKKIGITRFGSVTDFAVRA